METTLAGKRQHYIPQALMRGFCFKKDMTYAFRKEQNAPFPCNIKGIGVGTYFYGEENCETDNLITKFEGETDSLLKSLQCGDSNPSHHDISRWAQIMFIRTQCMRKSMNDLADETINEFCNFIESTNPLKLFEHELLSRRSIFKIQLIKSLKKSGKKLTKQQINNIVNNSDVLKNFIQSQEHQLTMFSDSLIRSFKNKRDDLGKNVQKKLVHNFIEKKKNIANYLKNIHWRTIEFSEDIILGDSPVYFTNNNETPFILSKDINDAKYVYIPITHNKALQGFKYKPSPISADKLNMLSASTSYDHFIARTNNAAKYMPHIGTHARIDHGFDFKEFFKNKYAEVDLTK